MCLLSYMLLVPERICIYIVTACIVMVNEFIIP